MKPRQQASRAALDLIERFEGYRRTAARLEDGRWTIGYGHTKTARQGAEVSEADAEALLIYDLMEVGGAVNDWVYTPLTQNQFDALCGFVFNIGLDNFRHSNVLRRLNEGDLLQAACAMEMWRRVDFEGEPIVLDALVRRRAAEKALFLTPLNGFMPAPMEAPVMWAEPSIAERAEPEPRLFSAEPMIFEDPESRRVAHHEVQSFEELELAPTEPLKGLNPITLWLGAAAMGLVVFAAGIFFGFSAKNSGLGAVIGWGLGITGIVFVATAVYFLLERLGGREEP